MRRFLTNWELKVLAVMAAMIFWFLVVGAENTFYTFPDEISVKAFNLSEELVVANELGGVKLRLKVENRDKIKSLTSDDFSAYVDLDGMGEGELDVHVSVSSKKSDARVLKVEPAKINVKIEKKIEKQVEINHVLLGEPKEGYKIDNVVVKEENATLKGSGSLLNTIDEANVYIELDNEDESFTGTYPLEIFDNDGDKIQNVTIEPQEIEVEVVITGEVGRKLVGVQPNIIGAPSGNKWVKSITAEPSFVVIKGDFKELQEIEYVKTKAVDVSDLKDSAEFNVEIEGLSQNTSVEDGGKIVVYVEIETIKSDKNSIKEKKTDVPVTIVKFRTDQENRVLSSPSVTIVAEGTEQNLNKISSSAKVELDISEYRDENEAVFQIDETNFSVPQGVNIISVDPSEVTVSW